MKLPPIPELLDRKISKTGQTRGADDVIYQNRVLRNSTVLIPFSTWRNGFTFPTSGSFENGYIVLVSPKEYFSTDDPVAFLKQFDLTLGTNSLVFYETREQWNNYNPEKMGWIPATQRQSPLGGEYVARVPGTTSKSKSERIARGFTSKNMKGAGIRVFEYASKETIHHCRLQLEALFWLTRDSTEAMLNSGMDVLSIELRKKSILEECRNLNLLDEKKLKKNRLINKQSNTICPLCLEELSGKDFLTRLEQAEGREVPDLTVTKVNLFHIEELRVGKYSHRPYNLGWGHHYCNVITRDIGIENTLSWLKEIIDRNEQHES